MVRYEYDEEASERLRMDVAHEIDDRPGSVERWRESLRRLNAIRDPLTRGLLELHRECGTGTGECDRGRDPVPMEERRDLGCETVSIIADHFDVEYP